MTTETKACSKCDKVKSLSEFSPRSRGGHQSWCRGCMNIYLKGHYAKNAERHAAYRAARQPEKKAYNAEYKAANFERLRVRRAELARARRLRVLGAYGGVCACCGETEYAFLTIDHTNNDGAEHRKSVPAPKIIVWLEKNGYPEGFQVLCWNCNAAKEFHGGCPHQDNPRSRDSSAA